MQLLYSLIFLLLSYNLPHRLLTHIYLRLKSALGGDNLKKIRVEKNVSQQELADLISSHSTHISRYERNMAAPSIDVVKKIAEALDVTTDTLIYGTQDEKVKNSLKDNELLNMFIKSQSLTNKQQDTVKDLLSAFFLKSDLQKNLAVAK